MKENYNIIIEPVITAQTTEIKGGNNVYTFKIHPRATKIDVRRAVEQIFKVKVERVNCIYVRGKQRGMRGRGLGSTSNWKKAYVKIAAGQKIELFEGA